MRNLSGNIKTIEEKKLRAAVARWRKAKSRLIVLTGPRKAGKDKLREYLKRNYPGIRDLRIAEAAAKIARVLELEPERKVFHALFGVNKILYPIIGQSAYARRVGRILDREKPKLAVVQAVRTHEEFEEFVLNRGGILIGVWADPLVRYSRAVADAKKNTEKRDEGQISFREFLGDPKKETGDYNPIEREIGRMMKKAHFVVNNNYRTPSLFYRDIDKIMDFLGLKKNK
jgi:hypothetical protein